MNLERIDHTEELRRHSQQRIDNTRTREERNRLGQFSTIPALGIQIVEFVVSLMPKNKSIAFLEPSVGSGVFYNALLRVVGRARIDSAVGIEIDEEFATLASSLWGNFGLTVINADFFNAAAHQIVGHQPNLLCANPPYSRHHHISPDTKRKIRRMIYEATGLSVSGLAGLYIYFFLLATSLLEDDGYAAWLIPAEFMDVNYGATLRDYLTRNVTTIRIHRFDPSDVQFDEALVTSAVVVVKKSKPKPGSSIEFTYGGTLLAPTSRQQKTIEQLQGCSKWSLFANGRQQSNDRENVGDVLTLGDLFHIQRGIATGANSFFVMTRDEAISLGIIEEFIKPVLPSPRYLETTIITSDENGYPNIERQLVLFDSDLPEADIEKKYPDVWKFLTSKAAFSLRNRYLIAKRSPWYRQEKRSPAPFLITYMGRSRDEQKPFRFIWNQSRAIATNMYLMMYPLKPLLNLISGDVKAQKALFDALNKITSEDFIDNGRVYGGGLHKMEPRELAAIPVPHIGTIFPTLTLTGKQQVLF